MTESARVQAARVAARREQVREVRALRPLGLVLIALAVVPSFSNDPGPDLHGRGLGVLAAIVVLVGVTLWIMFSGVVADLRDREAGGGGVAVRILQIVLLAIAGVVLTALQRDGAGELSIGIIAWNAATWLPAGLGAALTAAAVLALLVVFVAQGTGLDADAAASVLLAGLLFVVARTLRLRREDQVRLEVALAELQDARDRAAEASALAERARLARELHDVLAHALSGLTLQLEGARLLADRTGADPALRDAIGRARTLAGEGLDDARQAIGALRGDALDALAAIRHAAAQAHDAGLEVEVLVEGEVRPVGQEAAHALRRATQEALTNVLRHSGAERAAVVVTFGDGVVRLEVVDAAPVTAGVPGARAALAGAGSGHGLQGLRERAEQLGGRVEFGPTSHGGFRVLVEVPA